MTQIKAPPWPMDDKGAMTPELAAKYATPVPRYTSYPTAPHFSPAVDDAHYRRWLTAVDPDAPLSLYLHIPFCDSLCWFCGCHTRIVNRYGPIGDYLAVLGNEIDLVAEALGWSSQTREREIAHYEARVAAERESQEQFDDRTADAARLGAPDVRRSGSSSE